MQANVFLLPNVKNCVNTVIFGQRGTNKFDIYRVFCSRNSQILAKNSQTDSFLGPARINKSKDSKHLNLFFVSCCRFEVASAVMHFTQIHFYTNKLRYAQQPLRGAIFMRT